MIYPIADPTTVPAGRLSRRVAVRTYAPPALALVGAASLTSFGTSGQVKVEEPKSGGGGNPGGGGGGNPGGGGGGNPGGGGEDKKKK